MVDFKLTDLRPWREWVREEGGAVFRSEGAFEWFVRRHRHRLIQSGQFFPRMGPPGTMIGPGIGEAIVQIMREEAEEQVRNEAAA